VTVHFYETSQTSHFCGAHHNFGLFILFFT
jgi:hypothetical protein